MGVWGVSRGAIFLPGGDIRAPRATNFSLYSVILWPTIQTDRWCRSSLSITLALITAHYPSGAVAALSGQQISDRGIVSGNDIGVVDVPAVQMRVNAARLAHVSIESEIAAADADRRPVILSQASETASPPEPSAPDDSDPDPDKLLERLGGQRAESEDRLGRIDTALGRGRVFSDLRSLQEAILESQKPGINFSGRQSSQSDKLDIYQAELSQDLYFSRGRSQLRIGAQYLNFDPPSGGDITQLAAGFAGRHRVSDIVSINAEAWLNRIDLTNRDDYKLTYNAYLTLQPNDVIHVYLSTSAKTLDNVQSLTMGIIARSVGASIDYAPIESMRWSLRGSGEFYSDDNSKQAIEAEGLWRVLSRPILEIGGRGSYFRFSKVLNNGYFNPNEYYSGEVLFRLHSSLTKRLDAELTAAGGIEKADPGGTKPLIKSSLQLSYAASKHLSVDASASYFSSRDTGSSGFSRRTISLNIRYKF